MAMKKKSKTVGTLVKTRDLSAEELDAAIDQALDALFGKEEDKPSAKAPAAKKKKPDLKSTGSNESSS